MRNSLRESNEEHLLDTLDGLAELETRSVCQYDALGAGLHSTRVDCTHIKPGTSEGRVAASPLTQTQTSRAPTRSPRQQSGHPPSLHPL